MTWDQHVDQATYRILPGSKVRNAIYKAKLNEWDHIRAHMERKADLRLLLNDFSFFQVSMVSGLLQMKT